MVSSNLHVAHTTEVVNQQTVAWWCCGKRRKSLAFDRTLFQREIKNKIWYDELLKTREWRIRLDKQRSANGFTNEKQYVYRLFFEWKQLYSETDTRPSLKSHPIAKDKRPDVLVTCYFRHPIDSPINSGTTFCINHGQPLDFTMWIALKVAILIYRLWICVKNRDSSCDNNITLCNALTISDPCVERKNVASGFCLTFF